MGVALDMSALPLPEAGSPRAPSPPQASTAPFFVFPEARISCLALDSALRLRAETLEVKPGPEGRVAALCCRDAWESGY